MVNDDNNANENNTSCNNTYTFPEYMYMYDPPYQKIHANLSKKETHEINVSELMLPDVKPRVKFKLSSPELTSSGRHHIEIKFLAYAHLSLCYHDHAERYCKALILSFDQVYNCTKNAYTNTYLYRIGKPFSFLSAHIFGRDSARTAAAAAAATAASLYSSLSLFMLNHQQVPITTTITGRLTHKNAASLKYLTIAYLLGV
ncbi:hypothetical protein GQX74_007194 [Glossina fuscipes]|nr:hypothetical protein GQX74_007194 [Glossina fuscipes]